MSDIDHIDHYDAQRIDAERRAGEPENPLNLNTILEPSPPRPAPTAPPAFRQATPAAKPIARAVDSSKLNLETQKMIARIQAVRSLEELESLGTEINEALRFEMGLPIGHPEGKGDLPTPEPEYCLDAPALRFFYQQKASRFREVKVAGVSHRQPVVKTCQSGELLRMIPDPFGSEMIKIMTGNPRAMAELGPGTTPEGKWGHRDPKGVILAREVVGPAGAVRLYPVGYIPAKMDEQPFAAVYFDAMMESAKPLETWKAKVVCLVGGEGRGKDTTGLRVILPPAAPRN